MRPSVLLAFTSSTTLALLTTAHAARAQAPQSGTAAAASASTGKTEVTTNKFEAAARDEADAKDATSVSLSAGGVATAGNSRLVGITTANKLRLRRDNNQLSALLAASYNQSAVKGAPLVATVDNQQGKARYDRFLGDFVLFAGVQARRDRFQGIDLRLQLDPGIGYYAINEKKHLFWLELGYDWLHDIRRDDATAVVDAKGAPVLDANGVQLQLDKTNTVHSGRAFVGYSNTLNEQVSFDSGVEYLQGLSDTTYWKLNVDAALTSKLAGKFSLMSAISVRYDHAPLPGKETTDTTMSMNLVYTLF